MSEWKTYTELINEYNYVIDSLNKKLDTEVFMASNERSDINNQLAILIRAVANMRPYAEREKAKVGETLYGTND
jgi:hypothetical protein